MGNYFCVLAVTIIIVVIIIIIIITMLLLDLLPLLLTNCAIYCDIIVLFWSCLHSTKYCDFAKCHYIIQQ